MLLTVLASIASVVTLTSLERLANARAIAEAAQRTAAENQLKLLESQLEPHMLFNTLANLRPTCINPVRGLLPISSKARKSSSRRCRCITSSA